MPIFVIDPGHGGDDPGCSGSGLHEKDVNLAIANQLAIFMARVNDAMVVRTRSRDDTIKNLAERAAHSKGATLAIAIHCDVSANPNTVGLRTYARVEDVVAHRVGTFLASIAPGALIGAPGCTVASPDRASWTHRAYNVLHHHQCPALLVEMGFLSNPRNADFLTQKHGQLAMVSALMASCALAWSLEQKPSPPTHQV